MSPYCQGGCVCARDYAALSIRRSISLKFFVEVLGLTMASSPELSCYAEGNSVEDVKVRLQRRIDDDSDSDSDVLSDEGFESHNTAYDHSFLSENNNDSTRSLASSSYRDGFDTPVPPVEYPVGDSQNSNLDQFPVHHCNYNSTTFAEEFSSEHSSCDSFTDYHSDSRLKTVSNFLISFQYKIGLFFKICQIYTSFQYKYSLIFKIYSLQCKIAIKEHVEI